MLLVHRQAQSARVNQRLEREKPGFSLSLARSLALIFLIYYLRLNGTVVSSTSHLLLLLLFLPTELKLYITDLTPPPTPVSVYLFLATPVSISQEIRPFSHLRYNSFQYFFFFFKVSFKWNCNSVCVVVSYRSCVRRRPRCKLSIFYFSPLYISRLTLRAACCSLSLSPSKRRKDLDVPSLFSSPLLPPLYI